MKGPLKCLFHLHNLQRYEFQFCLDYFWSHHKLVLWHDQGHLDKHHLIFFFIYKMSSFSNLDFSNSIINISKYHCMPNNLYKQNFLIWWCLRLTPWDCPENPDLWTPGIWEWPEIHIFYSGSSLWFGLMEVAVYGIGWTYRRGHWNISLTSISF